MNYEANRGATTVAARPRRAHRRLNRSTFAATTYLPTDHGGFAADSSANGRAPVAAPGSGMQAKADQQ
jgi:hypothetical protein